MPINNKINAHYALVNTNNAIKEYQQTYSYTDVLDAIYVSVRKASNLGNKAVVFDFSDVMTHGHAFGAVAGALELALQEDGFLTDFMHIKKKRRALVLIDWSGEARENKKS